MPNSFLTTHMEVEGPPLVQEVEGARMADADVFPRWMYPAGGPTEPDYGGRAFASKEECAAAAGQWFLTPQEAQDAGPPPPAAPPPAPEDDAPHARRSHR